MSCIRSARLMGLCWLFSSSLFAQRPSLLCPAPRYHRLQVHAHGMMLYDRDIQTNNVQNLMLGCISATWQFPRTRWGVGVSYWSRRAIWDYWTSAYANPYWIPLPIIAPCVYASLPINPRWDFSWQAELLLVDDPIGVVTMVPQSFLAHYRIGKAWDIRLGAIYFHLIGSNVGGNFPLSVVPVLGAGWQLQPRFSSKSLKIRQIKPCKP